jgi:tetratricopeptide (TPR) repeat protein
MSLKDEGNAEFRQGNWLKAAALYTKAIKADPANAVLYRSEHWRPPPSPGIELSGLCKGKEGSYDTPEQDTYQRSIFTGQRWCCSNRSAALLKLKKAGKALEDAEACIRQRPDWDKGHYRRALALELTEKYSEVRAHARTCHRHALSCGAGDQQNLERDVIVQHLRLVTRLRQE